MEGTRIWRTEWKFIDPALWYTPIGQDSSDLHITTYLANKVTMYRHQLNAWEDRDMLLQQFQDDFVNWDAACFGRVPNSFAIELRKTLRESGINHALITSKRV